MSDKEFKTSKVSQLGSSSVVVLTSRAAKRVLSFCIVMNRNERVGVELFMNLRLCLRRAEAIPPGDVQQQRTAQILGFGKAFFNADSVITNGAVRLETH